MKKIHSIILSFDKCCLSFDENLCAYTTGFFSKSDSFVKTNPYSDLFYRDLQIEDDDDLMAVHKNPFYGSIRYEWSSVDIWSPFQSIHSKIYGVDHNGSYGFKNENYKFPAFCDLEIFLLCELSYDLLNIIFDRSKDFLSKFQNHVELVEVNSFLEKSTTVKKKLLSISH